MSNNNTGYSEKLAEAIGEIDDSFLQEADRFHADAVRRRKISARRQLRTFGLTLAAACFLGVLIVVPRLLSGKGNSMEMASTAPAAAEATAGAAYDSMPESSKDAAAVPAYEPEAEASYYENGAYAEEADGMAEAPAEPAFASPDASMTQSSGAQTVAPSVQNDGMNRDTAGTTSAKTDAEAPGAPSDVILSLTLDYTSYDLERNSLQTIHAAEGKSDYKAQFLLVTAGGSSPDVTRMELCRFPANTAMSRMVPEEAEATELHEVSGTEAEATLTRDAAYLIRFGNEKDDLSINYYVVIR